MSASEKLNRRSFFKAVAVGGAGAAAAVATVTVARELKPQGTPLDEGARVGYRETDHVRHYYRTAKV